LQEPFPAIDGGSRGDDRLQTQMDWYSQESLIGMKSTGEAYV
jgi:hypothetical protein